MVFSKLNCHSLRGHMKKIDFNKIKYSKCPACKKHGISAFNKIGYRYNPVVECHYCKKKFSVNIALSIIMKIVISIFVGAIAIIVDTYIVKVPLLIWAIIALILLFLFEYFAPLSDAD